MLCSNSRRACTAGHARVRGFVTTTGQGNAADQLLNHVVSKSAPERGPDGAGAGDGAVAHRAMARDRASSGNSSRLTTRLPTPRITSRQMVSTTISTIDVSISGAPHAVILSAPIPRPRPDPVRRSSSDCRSNGVRAARSEGGHQSVLVLHKADCSRGKRWYPSQVQRLAVSSFRTESRTACASVRLGLVGAS